MDIIQALTRPARELTTEERGEIKKVARQLLEKFRTLRVINWRQKNSARSQDQKIQKGIHSVQRRAKCRSRGLVTL